MKTRLLIAVPALLAVVALAGALGPSPDPAGAQQPADSSTDSVTVNGVGTVKSVPDEANFSFGVETRARTAQAAIAANAAQMEKLIAALRQAGARDIATQWVSVYPVMSDENTSRRLLGFEQRVGDHRRRACRCPHRRRGRRGCEPDLRARPELERRRASLQEGARCCGRRRPRARRGAREGCRPLARRDHHDGGVRRHAGPPLPGAADAAVSSTPIEPGQQETTATVSVTFDLR